MKRIPVAEPSLVGNEKAYVLDALESSWISSSGKYIDRFEAEFATACGSKYSLTVSNGTVALQLALLALGAGPGDEVIVPSLTYIATANAVRYVGATPVFADISADSWGLDPESVSRSITDRTVGVIPVHLYGHPVDMDPLVEVARSKGLWIIEDAAEATFGSYKNRQVGSLGDIATFSFYGNKIITSGEGGAVTTNSAEIAAKMRLIRGQGMDPERRYFFPIVGHNFRLTNVAAAILCAQLERREEIIAQRHLVCQQYDEQLSSLKGIQFQPKQRWASWTPWLYSILIDEDCYKASRDKVASELLSRGVDTRPFFVPIHTLPPYQSIEFAPRVSLDVTTSIAPRGLNLPTSPEMLPATVDYVCEALTMALKA